MRFKRPQVRYADTPQPATPYQSAAQVWDDRIGSARVQAKNWRRFMAFGCLTLAVLMAGGLVWRSAQSIVTPYVIEVDNAGQVRAVGEAATPYRPNDAQIATTWALHRPGALAVHRPIVVRQNWLDAYDYTTDKGAVVLNEYARVNDPFARIGKESVTVQITSVTRASDTSFNVRWTERFRQWRAGSHRTLERRGFHRAADAAHRAACARTPGHLRQRPVVEPRTGSERRSKTMNDLFRKSALPVICWLRPCCSLAAPRRASRRRPSRSMSRCRPSRCRSRLRRWRWWPCRRCCRCRRR